MTDEEVAEYANCTVAEAAIIRERAPHYIVAFERMRQFEREWNEYLVGVGPRPIGVLMDEDRSP